MRKLLIIIAPSLLTLTMHGAAISGDSCQPTVIPTQMSGHFERTSTQDPRVSIQDLINNGAKLKVSDDGLLDLRNKNIDSLVGLQNVQGIENLLRFSLDNNKLTGIQPDMLASLKNLISLSLVNNRITDIKPGAFMGLDNLRLLLLSNNRLTEKEKERIDQEIREIIPRVTIIF